MLVFLATHWEHCCWACKQNTDRTTDDGFQHGSGCELRSWRNIDISGIEVNYLNDTGYYGDITIKVRNSFTKFNITSLFDRQAFGRTVVYRNYCPVATDIDDININMKFKASDIFPLDSDGNVSNKPYLVGTIRGGKISFSIKTPLKSAAMDYPLAFIFTAEELSDT